MCLGANDPRSAHWAVVVAMVVVLVVVFGEDVVLSPDGTIEGASEAAMITVRVDVEVNPF